MGRFLRNGEEGGRGRGAERRERRRRRRGKGGEEEDLRGDLAWAHSGWVVEGSRSARGPASAQGRSRWSCSRLRGEEGRGRGPGQGGSGPDVATGSTTSSAHALRNNGAKMSKKSMRRRENARRGSLGRMRIERRRSGEEASLRATGNWVIKSNKKAVARVVKSSERPPASDREEEAKR